ncbi:MAG: dienelactone hydrolase family protein [Phycisphaerales bacterium]|nr:dienelactone hydrolase family protein [Phycisphaerales bacterium]
MTIARTIALVLLTLAPAAWAGGTWDQIRQQASERFGEAGAEAAAFLAEHRPERDAQIDPEIVLVAIELSLRARETYPWAKELDDELFFNDVLPYAVLDEERARSRRRVHELAAPIVEGSATAAEAVQALNRELFRSTGVRYSTERRRANQNSNETLDLALASCTGLSILLIEACRSVGVPARIAGVASWPGSGGNHAWIEIHDGERWRFTGAAEYNAGGLDRAWFVGRARSTVPGHRLHGVWASSWRQTGDHYPLAWNIQDTGVPGVDVTGTYARAGTSAEPVLGVRLWASRGGPRLAADASIKHDGKTHTSRTFADPDDINRVAEFPAIDARPLKIVLRVDGVERSATLGERHAAGRVIELYWDELGLSRDEAEESSRRLWREHAEAIAEERRSELEAGVIELGGHELRLLERRFGDAPDAGPSLWISMHGGGGTTVEVNDRQWRNQIRLYEPEEGIYIAPRAPSDTWNLWHRPEIDALFGRLIESAIVVWGVDPDRVYLMGYSAGGDGAYQLAPRLADRFAAASMMAGHPNDATPHGLRNLPFAIFMGENDGAFNRNSVAKEWGEKLADLREADPEGYPHMVKIYPDLGHWMERRDAEGVPWMAGHTRNPWPSRVFWRQGNTTHQRFYWLAVDPEHAARGRKITASVEGQTITIESADVPQVELLLSDELLDLDRPVKVIANGREVFEGQIARTKEAIARSIELRPDPRMIATATLKIELAKQ